MSLERVVVVVLQSSHHGGHQFLQLLGPLPARLQDFLVVGLLLAVIVHHCPVADQRHGEATHPGMTGDDHLMYGAHTCRQTEGETSVRKVLNIRLVCCC